MRRWTLPLACLAILAGVFGPWVNHAAAGLVVTGLDLGEYVKFMPGVRRGEIWLWRPGFYAPLVAVSTTCLLAAYRRDLRYMGWQRVALLLLALVSALNLLPPAWTPARLLEPEFRWQTASLILLLGGVAFSPFLALLPWRAAATVITPLALAGVFFPVQGFFAVLPAISELMAQPVFPAWGLWLALAGAAALIGILWFPDSIAGVPTRGHPSTSEVS